MELGVFNMAAGDIPSVLQIEVNCFPEPLKEQDFIAGAGEGLSFVARAGGVVEGYILCSKVLDECHVIRIAVREGMREKGIGKRMMEKLFEEAKGINKFYLEVRASNLAAGKFYKKMGFTESYVRKKYYSDNGEDAVFMEKVAGVRE